MGNFNNGEAGMTDRYESIAKCIELAGNWAIGYQHKDIPETLAQARALLAELRDARAAAWMFWNEPDTQRHFTLTPELVGSHWQHRTPLYSHPPAALGEALHC